MITISTYRIIPEDMSTPITFDIGFLGYTSELSIKGLKKFAENNKEQVKDKKFNNCNAEVYLYDGTRIKAITYGMNLRGYKFDQLILFDDNRWNIGKERYQWEIIDEIRTYNMVMSNVPDEYQFLYYEDI